MTDPRTGPHRVLCPLAAALAAVVLAACDDSPTASTMASWLPAEHLGEIEEVTDGFDSAGVEAEIAYPALPGADALTEHLEQVTSQHAEDFALAVPEAERITFDWQLTALATDFVGVRLTAEEEVEDDGVRTTYQTLWYDAASGRTAGSTELLANHQALIALSELAADELRTSEEEAEVDRHAILPIARLFNSIGFTVLGDLVVEFDGGTVADDDRAYAVVERELAEPLLSNLGRRALAASIEVPDELELIAPPEEIGDVDPDRIPGTIPPHDDAVDCGDRHTRCVALTFDAGPGERAPELLDAFAEYNGKATFFVTGDLASLRPETVRRIYAEGHELGNHTMTGPDLTELSEAEATAEVESLQALLRREAGYTPAIFRPPFGETNEAVREAVGGLDMAQIGRSVDTEGWRDQDPDMVADRVTGGTVPGSIVLMEDIHDSTVDAVPPVLEALDEQGYSFVTVTQLLGETEPGETYWTATENSTDLLPGTEYDYNDGLG